MGIYETLLSEMDRVREETKMHLLRALDVVDTDVGLQDLISQAQSSARTLETLQSIAKLHAPLDASSVVQLAIHAPVPDVNEGTEVSSTRVTYPDPIPEDDLKFPEFGTHVKGDNEVAIEPEVSPLQSGSVDSTPKKPRGAFSFETLARD